MLTSITLQGFAIGNGLTDPALQYPAYPDYALEMGLITQKEHDRLEKIVPLCELSIKLCGTYSSIPYQFIFKIALCLMNPESLFLFFQELMAQLLVWHHILFATPCSVV